MRVVNVPSYVSTDGITFSSKEECERHEILLTNVKYFRIVYEPDLSEGRGWGKRIVVAVNTKVNHEKFVEHLCYEIFGNKIAFIMGHYGNKALIANWMIYEASKEDIEELEIKYRIEDVMVGNCIWEDSIRSEKDIVELKRLEREAR